MELSDYSPLGKKTIQILQTLSAHPYLSAQQLSWHLHRGESAIQRLLWQLQQKQYIRRYSLFVESEKKIQWLYLLTTQGLTALARAEHLSSRAYQEQSRYSISRLRWLVLVLDRVYHTREILRYVDATNLGGWSVTQWGSETEIRYEKQAGWRHLTFQCSAIMHNHAQRWIPVMIEWDNGDIPITAQSPYWRNLMMAQQDPMFSYSFESQIPILIFVARDVERFLQFIDLIDGIHKQPSRLWIPTAYLTHRDKLCDTLPWFDTVAGDWCPHVLASCKGNTNPSWVFWKNRPLRQSYAKPDVDIKPISNAVIPQDNLRDIASLALALRPLERRLLSAIGSHPLLTARELGDLFESALSKVWEAVTRLRQWELIQAYTCRVPMQKAKRYAQVQAYILSDSGLVYLAAAAGLGITPKRIAAAHGWEKGFDAQVYHGDHTRIGNELFLQLLEFARAHHYPMTWYSEQEARLYLNLSGQKWSGPFQSVRITPISSYRMSEREEENAGEHEEYLAVEDASSTRDEFLRELAEHGTRYRRFLPDGRAVLQIGDTDWHIAVEVDLTRANYQKMIAKLDYYQMLLDYHLEKPTLRVLMVTRHWQRAQNLYWLAWARATQEIDHRHRVDFQLDKDTLFDALSIAEKHLAQELSRGVLPVYITTVDELRKHGLDQPIWLRVREQLGQDGCVIHSFTRTRCLENLNERI